MNSLVVFVAAQVPLEMRSNLKPLQLDTTISKAGKIEDSWASSVLFLLCTLKPVFLLQTKVESCLECVDVDYEKTWRKLTLATNFCCFRPGP